MNAFQISTPGFFLLMLLLLIGSWADSRILYTFAAWSAPVGFQKQHVGTHYRSHSSVIQLHLSLKSIQVDLRGNHQRLIFTCLSASLKKLYWRIWLWTESETFVLENLDIQKMQKQQITSLKTLHNKLRSSTKREVKTKNYRLSLLNSWQLLLLFPYL